MKFCKIDNEIYAYTDKLAKEYNLKVIKDVSDKTFEDAGGMFYVKNNEIILGRDPVFAIQKEMRQLTRWFNDYDLQVKQYERATRLGETFDKDIKMLDNEAIEKASRVKELRKLLEG